MPWAIVTSHRLFYRSDLTANSCPFVLNTHYYLNDGKRSKICNAAYQERRLAAINASPDPAIVVIGGRYPVFLDNVFFDNGEGGFEDEVFGEFIPDNGGDFKDALRGSIETLTAAGHHVVLVYPIPPVGWHVPKRLFEKVKGMDLVQIRDVLQNDPVSTDADIYHEDSHSTFALFNSIQHPNIHRVYPHTLFCNTVISGRCVTHDENDIFYDDDDHPSAKGAAMINALIDDAVRAADTAIKTARDR
ncbi:MAG: SGNH hydrolase domain-containing protein [Alphaproteobacteria bacterium]